MSCSPKPLYRSMFNGGPGQDVLKRVKRMKVKAGAKTFFFKLHSGTLPAKQWLSDKGIDVPWTTNCLLCKTPETIDHVFIHCWDAVFHWDILQRTLKKDLPITSHGIRFLCVDNEDAIPYDMVMLISFHSNWQTTMAYRLDQNMRPVRENFIANMRYITEVYKQEEEPPS
uniref:Putative tick transposon n=1 Tax=Rhipicephalus microplus TaxID=6941 RepID=A0A6M2CQP8_RHIMP